MAKTWILGVSAYYHDSAAALLCDGAIVAAAQEERFSRRKHDAAFPSRAAAFCLEQAGVRAADLAAVAFYEKPLLKFERLIDTYLTFAPRGVSSFVAAMPAWTREKLFQRSLIRKALAELPGAAGPCPPLLFPDHHRSHAASAFFPSPFQRAAVLCVDGVGERATTSAWVGDDHRLTPLWRLDFPHSLGLLYSAFTQYLGFRVNSAEYKVMGLAPYGQPRYVDRILGTLLDLKEDGTFRLDLRYFGFATGLTMTNRAFHELFEGPPRAPESALGQREKDVARSIQAVTEEVVLRLARTLRRETGERTLCLAGGVALNCVANARIAREAGFEDVWIQPAAGDAGGALGAALSAWHEQHGAPRTPAFPDAMNGALLGPSFEAPDIDETLRRYGAVTHAPANEDVLLARTAELLASGGVVGWFQGPMEYGPRALGNRSILGDPRDPAMQSRMNLKIKFRESFRPFAPAVPAERARRYFDLDRESPYMLLVAQVAGPSANALPAITHVDGSARVQTIREDANPLFHRLLSAFEQRSGCPVLVNTSFNVRSEPIVCTPADAYRCFMKTGMDHLVIGGRILHKSEQPPFTEPPPRDGPAGAPAGLLRRAARLLAPVHALWMRLAAALGWINTRLVFGAVHLIVVTPYALALRALGKPPLALDFDRGAASYRTDAAVDPPGGLDRPY